MSTGVSLILGTLAEVKRMAGKPTIPATCIETHVGLYELYNRENISNKKMVTETTLVLANKSSVNVHIFT